MIEEDDLKTRYEEARQQASDTFSKFTPVKCPALKNEQVHFTSEGFNHLIYKSSRSERSREEQLARFRCLEHARKLISMTTTIQEREEKLQEIEVKKFKRREKEHKIVCYWGFVAIVANKKFKVIVKRIGNGKLIFWSVIPNWKSTIHNNIRVKDFASGDLEAD